MLDKHRQSIQMESRISQLQFTSDAESKSKQKLKQEMMELSQNYIKTQNEFSDIAKQLQRLINSQQSHHSTLDTNKDDDDSSMPRLNPNVDPIFLQK